MLPVTTMSWPGCSFSARTSWMGHRTGPWSLPLRVGHGRGDDVLLHSVEVVSNAGGVVGLLGPVAAQILEGLPAHEKPVGSAVLLVQLLKQI
jgi:hypothetical protein